MNDTRIRLACKVIALRRILFEPVLCCFSKIPEVEQVYYGYKRTSDFRQDSTVMRGIFNVAT